MRNSEEPPYLERNGCPRDFEGRSNTSQSNIVPYKSSQSRLTFEEITSLLARRTVIEEVIFDDRLGSSTVGLRHERSRGQRLKKSKDSCDNTLDNAEFRIGKLFPRSYQKHKYHTIFRKTVFGICKVCLHSGRIQVSVYMSLHLSKEYRRMGQLQNQRTLKMRLEDKSKTMNRIS